MSLRKEETFGEIILNRSLSFAGESIHEIVAVLNLLFEQARKSDTAEIELKCILSRMEKMITI